MDLESILLGSAAVALCAVPFLLMHKLSKNSEKLFLLHLKNLADSIGSSLGERECGLEFAISLAQNKQHLFYVKERNNQVQKEILQLSDYSKCTIDRVNKTINTPEGKETVIDRLSLKFHPVKSKSEFKILDIYNSDENFQLNGEWVLIRKWEAIINEAISQKS